MISHRDAEIAEKTEKEGCMEIEKCQGYATLLAAVMKDVQGGEGCFNPEGCTYSRTKSFRCFHRYCDKFKWVIDRARAYAEKAGIDASAILDAWEEPRNYWYMNYYQDVNQPLLTGDRVRVFDTAEQMLESVGKSGFRCPMCKGVSKNPYQCDTGLEMSEGKVCDWKAYGLFGTLGQGASVYVKSQLKGETFFMPIAWEE